MCGIVGYVGTQEAAPILLDGLRRLEYRGYDSAGIAVLGDDAVLLAKLGAICVVIVLNFCAYRFVVWPRRRTRA